MVIYIGQDLKDTLFGDIIVSANGDLTLASTTHTHFQQTAFRLRTDPDDLTTTLRDVGANLGVFIGESLNEQLLKDIEDQVKSSLTEELINKNDLEVIAVPVDVDEVLLYIRHKGLFINANGLQESEGYEAVFSFPIFEGDAIQLIQYQSL